MTFTERGGWWVVAQLGLFGLYAVALFGTEPTSEGVFLSFAQIVGAVLGALAALIGVWAALVLGRNLTIYPSPVHQATLADAGPYRLVRHPIYLAVFVGALGLSLTLLSPAAVLVSLVFVVFFMAKSGFEEDRLIARVPGYREYRSRIPYRIIPWVM